jgi:hypothetical protein
MLNKNEMLNILRSNHGLATIEALPILIIFLILIAYMLGLFGTIHTGILQNIAARNYSFETFRHRADLTYFRDNRMGDPITAQVHYAKTQLRLHGISTVENVQGRSRNWVPSERPISYPNNLFALEEVGRSIREHNKIMPGIKAGQRYSASEGVNPVWIKTTYGFCIRAECGD